MGDVCLIAASMDLGDCEYPPRQLHAILPSFCLANLDAQPPTSELSVYTFQRQPNAVSKTSASWVSYRINCLNVKLKMAEVHKLTANRTFTSIVMAFILPWSPFMAAAWVPKASTPDSIDEHAIAVGFLDSNLRRRSGKRNQKIGKVTMLSL
jgi:hypothetical protein